MAIKMVYQGISHSSLGFLCIHKVNTSDLWAVSTVYHSKALHNYYVFDLQIISSEDVITAVVSTT